MGYNFYGPGLELEPGKLLVRTVYTCLVQVPFLSCIFNLALKKEQCCYKQMLSLMISLKETLPYMEYSLVV